jgi:hypothetical protein
MDDDYWFMQRYAALFYTAHGHQVQELCPEDCKGRDEADAH